MTQPKPRISHLSPPYTPDVEHALSQMMSGRHDREPLKLFRSFARDLPFTAAMGPLGQFMLSSRDRNGAAFDLRTREIVIDRVCAQCRCEYEWGVHVAVYSKKAGLDEEQLRSIVNGDAEDACWSEKDRAVITMVDELHSAGTLSDAAFAALSRHYQTVEIIELFALAGWYHAIAYMANAMRTELEDWAPRFPRSGA